MNKCDPNDDTWEDFFGASTELMPSIMTVFDTIIQTNKNTPETEDFEEIRSTSTPKRTTQASNFSNLSPCVQKIISNVPDQELSRNFASERFLPLWRSTNGTRRGAEFRSMRNLDRRQTNDSMDIISPNVQKMISNFPDTELTISAVGKNGSFLHLNHGKADFALNNNNNKTVLVSSPDNNTNNSECDVGVDCNNSNRKNVNNNNKEDSFSKPLGSYLHTSYGIASRTPVGRKNMWRLQVPSEVSTVTNSSTASSEVSRPVSLTSLGSCSSSGSSGPHQPSSAYLASAESLDSDPEPTGSQGSADSGIGDQPTMSPDARVIQEVLDTESVYVADLGDVIQGYLQIWRTDLQCPLAEYLSRLFNNIEEIHKFNKNFLEQLRETSGNCTKTANVFIQNNSGFVIYNEYCTNYPSTMEVLGELTRDEKMVSLFRERQVALGHALPLGSYLLKPVQRILKYHLLLQRLSKLCDSGDKPAVDLALTTMTAVATDINNMKRKHENAIRVHEIQAQLYGWEGPDLTALGELVAEGTFRVSGARARRHVFLFDKVLLLAKSKQGGALIYKSHIMCSNLMLVEQVRGDSSSFQVLPFDNPRLQCTLRARSPQHKREWTLQIKRVILENYNADIPNHAKQLVMQLGQENVDLTEDSTEKYSPKNSTPHYLERRSRMRKSRNDKRASSQDRTFPSLGSWRRKSEPSMDQIPQYTAKTVPKKITKLKKSKLGGSTFYTDLSDSENFDKSTESLHTLNGADNNKADEEKREMDETKEDHLDPNLEQIVSDLIMQNHQEFQKLMYRKKRNVKNSESEPAIWTEDGGATKLPSKADSLPRSFQLNDKIGADMGDNGSKGHFKHVLDNSLSENPEDADQHENDLSSHMDDNEYPVHKIYRKTTMRFSFLQRMRALLSEEEAKILPYPLHKQGSRSMGEKIAHPDYADPQKLFSSNLNVELSECDPLEEPVRLDMTINENEVLKELEKRLNRGNHLWDFRNGASHTKDPADGDISSQRKSGGDCYYESILEDSLVEEYTRDENGKLVAKQDSFRNAENKYLSLKNSANLDPQGFVSLNGNGGSKVHPKRPTKPPPPIPTKPTRLIVSSKSVLTKNSTSVTRKEAATITENGHRECETTKQQLSSSNISEKSWVKTMVGRFE